MYVTLSSRRGFLKLVGAGAAPVGAAPAPGGAEEAPTGVDEAGPEQNEKGGATYLKANTGVSAETGRPLSDSRYINAETGKVKHFPQAPGEGENGKPISGKRIANENGNREALDVNSDVAQPRAEKMGREVFQYTDRAKNHAEQCEKCRFFDGQSTCKLYEQFNEAMPEQFALDVNVKPTGWCDQFEAKGQTNAADNR